MRRLCVLLLTGLLCAAPAPIALAQSGDDPTITDPFEEGLSQTPQTEGSSEEAEPEAADEGPAASEQPAASARELPNTGSDARLLALAGCSLLLVGAGLRLRTIPEW